MTTQETKFTPGEWTVGQQDGKLYIDCGGSLPLIAVVEQYHDRHKANAQLMASSKTLYDACQSAEQVITAIECGQDKPVSTGMILDALRAVLATAERK